MMKLAHSSPFGLSPATGSAPRILRGRPQFSAIRTLIAKLLGWQARAAERRHLRMLDDHMLVDLGLTHADVYFESRKPFWKL